MSSGVWCAKSGVRQGGAWRDAMILGARARMSDRNIYARMMTLPYEVIAARGVWHALRVWHRTWMRAVLMETTCESLASELRFIECRNSVGRGISTKTLVESTLVRAAGFRGDLTDGVGVYRALCEHFGSEGGSSKFHFTRRGNQPAASGRMLLDEKYIFGPSCTLARERARMFDDKRLRPSWLSSSAPAHVHKRIRREGRLGDSGDSFVPGAWADVSAMVRQAGIPLPQAR